MALQISNLEREFKYNGMTLADPNPDLSVKEVQAIHAATFPELTNAKPMVERTNTTNGTREQISFSVPVGTKG